MTYEHANLDYLTLYRFATTISNFVSYYNGVIIVLITVLMGIVTCNDMLFLNNIISLDDDSGSVTSNKLGITNIVKFKMISVDARKSKEEAYLSGRNPVNVYFFKRIKLYIFASITCILLAGGGKIIINFASDIMSRIIPMFLKQ